MNWPEEIFITGTDTGIGKTLVSAMLVKGLGSSYWKPVQSGLAEETDTEAVRRLTQLPDSHFKKETYRLNEPLSPHASAGIDGVHIDMDEFRIPVYKTNHLIVEGAGGVLVPLNEGFLMIDLMARLQLPVLIVARSGLGTLNHTLLTLEALQKRNISVLGVVMNGAKNKSNREAIEHYGETSVLAEIEPLKEVHPSALQKEFERHF